MNSKYYAALAKGLCGQCYIRPAVSPTVRCKECTETTNSKAAERSKKQRQTYKDNNKCIRCGAPLDEDDKGYVHCVNCRSSKILSLAMTRRNKCNG